ncbi:DUF4412 domain-containing protein [Aliifodinibius sp. S!AR15-10]|uniref:DUF4412 domain-containing protein n=1 Tax=Aliifodinibius sp. S!AR15-10 TaxID=2950437 RepID=UPI0028664805|nr:DUF4412 domain-containing protein [Aliifodinibius sp. S!AR15-10]MDR8392756.1 DUF4412 domain-containing protein [Aliifodinibius sp. S!AR15-10]
MIKQLGYYVIGAVLLTLISLPAAAQFEGKMVFNSYEVTPDGSQKQNDQFSLFLTKDRILVEGKNQYNFVGSIKTEGILIRLDFEDFVFLTGDQSALKISKQDIDSMMNMFGNGSSGTDGSMDHEVNYEQTGETRDINGYSCEKFIFTDRENPNEHAEVWLTDELNIHWGMLAEPWGNSDLNLLGDKLSFDLIFKKGYFPMRIEGYRDGNLRQITEIQEIEESNVARAMVQIPQGVQVLSFQDYLFNKMSEQ